jgi:hypothetical protein
MNAAREQQPGTIARLFGKLKGRSFAELRERAGQRFAAELEARGVGSSVRLPTDRALWVALQLLGDPDADGIADRIHGHFTTRSSPAFFAGVRDGSTAAELRGPRWSENVRSLVASADRMLSGTFDLLGYTGLSFGEPVDWHFDPTTNRHAPRVHWSRVPYLDAERVGDHKVIWEINRHQHFMVLGRAFQVTGNEAYAEYFAAQLASWMDENPPKTGINWASSLEVAYRSIAWLWAIELFRDSPALTPAILTRALGHLSLNGRHLERYLSTYFSPNTHLTGEALGLLYLGVCLPELERAAQWRQTGWAVLERMLPRHILPDGVYFEQASYYHRYTVDIYLHALLLARMQQIIVPQPMIDRLGAAVGHLADITRPDGSIPAIGDDDGGRLVMLETRAFTDVRSALGVASVVLKRPEFAAVAGGATEELVWLLGPAGLRTIDASRGASPPPHLSKLFPDGGYAVMRDGWGADTKHAVIDCGPLGSMNAGHAHSDALAIEISVGGCAVLVDPGTYTYTVSPTDRDRFRHSASHNTVTVDGHSASVPSGQFSWAHRGDACVERFSTGAIADLFTGSHAGFERLEDPVVHRRTVLFVRGEYWVIVDSILAGGAHESTAHFHAAIGTSVAPASPNSAWLTVPCAGAPKRLLFSVAGDVDALDWSQDWVSPAYGSRVLAPHGRLVARGTGRKDLITVLVPASGERDVSVEELPTSSGRAVLVSRHDRRDMVLCSTGRGILLEGVEASADVAVIQRTGGSAIDTVALFGSAASVSIDGFTANATGAAEFTRRGDVWRVEGNGFVT